MTRDYRFNPPYKAPLVPEIDLLVLAARRSARGILASLQVWNEEPVYAERVAMEVLPERRRFIREVVTRKPILTADTLESALLKVTMFLDGKLTRGKTRTTGGAPAADPTQADDERHSLPWINASEQNLRIVTAEAWKALLRANAPEPKLFRYGGLPTRLEQDDNTDLFPVDLSSDRMRHVLARCANWYKDVPVESDDGTGESIRLIVRPPSDVVRDVLATPDPPLPVLRRIVEVPVFAPDGTLQTDRGYHSASLTYYQPRAGFSLESVPERPTADDVTLAKRLILVEVLADFPFVQAADRAHAVALLLLPFCRDLIDGPTPLHVIEAPSAGSGKGLLAEVCLLPAIGGRFGTLSPGRDEEEWRKSITTVLRWGHEAIWIDNINQPLKSGDLAAALTSPMWEDRILGQSRSVRIPVRCVWLATANNPVLSEELTRRSIRIRIDSKMDRPWLREGFQHPNLRKWVHTHRAQLVWAALVLVRAWVVAGRPEPKVAPIGSYEAWSRVTGGILKGADIPGFLDNLSQFYEVANTEAAAWRAFVTAWWKKWDSQPVTAKDLLPVALQFDELDIGGKDERGQTRSLGKKLASQRDRVIGEYLVRHSGEKDHATQWKLELAPDPSTTKPENPGREVADGT
jgi:putative DNA primase/helicase